MAKKTVKKAPAKKTAKNDASVGPVKGSLETKPDVPAIKPVEGLKVGKPVSKSKTVYEQEVNEQFNTIEKTLLATNDAKKQPRQLRWALKSLDAAKDAALRHIRHNG
jgi:hypothetical protein